MSINTGDIKILQKFITEPNEFKRFILISLWSNQLFSSTFTDPIALFKEEISKIPVRIGNEQENKENDLKNKTEEELYYQLFANIKKRLIAKVKEYEEVKSEMVVQNRILKIMNKVLDLKEESQINKSLNSLSAMIFKYNDYINRLNNLSEAEILSIIKDERCENN